MCQTGGLRARNKPRTASRIFNSAVRRRRIARLGSHEVGCGSGRARRPPRETWSVPQYAKDVGLLARAMGLREYAVLGHSFGQFVALQHAVDFPKTAQTIISSGEEVSSYFIYGELADLYRRIGETEKHKKYAALFRARRGITMGCSRPVKQVEGGPVAEPIPKTAADPAGLRPRATL